MNGLGCPIESEKGWWSRPAQRLYQPAEPDKPEVYCTSPLFGHSVRFSCLLVFSAMAARGAATCGMA
jgi:hypothetical protein